MSATGMATKIIKPPRASMMAFLVSLDILVSFVGCYGFIITQTRQTTTKKFYKKFLDKYRFLWYHKSARALAAPKMLKMI